MIIGAKKQKNQAQKPNIQKDTTASTEFVQALYGLAEGEILGLVDGGKSIKLDGTPLINDNGQPNFDNVSWDFRAGTLNQDYIKGFSSVNNESNVGVELRHDKPYIKAINNTALDAVIIRLGWGSLREQKDNGDIVGYRIAYAVDVQTDGGAWSEVLNTFINDKASQGYKRSHRIELPKARRGWTIRVRRTTPNRDSELIGDSMSVVAITEVIDAKLCYPLTALLAVKYDAESFSNIAKLSVRLRGKLIQVPSNYNPTTRTYNGMWDGTFKLAYSNNPAWVYYDICTHKRYGLGLTVDKWQLYQIAQYCDEMVDDGKGGKEPRFTCNVYLQKAEDAYQVLQSLASVFRGLTFWDGTQIVVDSDVPKDPVYTFSRSNVAGGEFIYSGTRRRDRHTVFKVGWDNPDNDYKTEYEMIRDDYAIAKYGINILDINAFGCTSQAQAQRVGQWALKTEQLETQSVSFKTGLDGFIPKVGDVINVADNVRAGRAISGRIVSVNGNKITLDRNAGSVGNTIVIGEHTAKITAIAGTVITLDKPINAKANEIWAMTATDLHLAQYRVMSIAYDDASFNVTAIEYRPEKYSDAVRIEPRPISVIKPTILSAPSQVLLTSHSRTHQGQSVTTLSINWEQVNGAVGYIVEWKKDDNAWQKSKIASQSIDIDGVYSGNYTARVAAVDAFDNQSSFATSVLTTVTGKTGKPKKPIGLTAKGGLFSMMIAWAFDTGSEDTNFTEIQVSPDGRTNISTLATFAYPTNKHEITGLQGNLTQFYRARIVDKLGNASDWTAWASGTTEAQAEKVLNLISGQINQSHLHQSLSTPIAKIAPLETSINSTRNELNASKTTLNQAVANISTHRQQITQAVANITSLMSDKNTKTQQITNLTQSVNNHASSIRELSVTTGTLNQKYGELKTQADNATSQITQIAQTQQGQAASIERMGARFDHGNLFKANIATQGHYLDNQDSGALKPWNSHRASDFIAVKSNTNYEIRAFGGDFNNLRTIWYDENKNFIKGQIVAKNGDYATFNSDNASFIRISSYWTRQADNIWQMQQVGLAGDVQANLDVIQRTLANADIALSQQITAMDAAYKQADSQANAKIDSEITARSNADSALSSRIDSLQSDYNGNKANIANQLKTLSDNDKAKASQITSLNANFTTVQNMANNAQRTADTANSKADNAQRTANAANAAITAEQTARADADSSLASRISALDTAYKSADSTLTSRIASEETARANGDNANAQAIRTLNSTVQGINGRVGTAESKITTLERTTSNTTQALATAQSQLNARFDNLAVGGRNLLLGSAVSRTTHGTTSLQLSQNINHADITNLVISCDVAYTNARRATTQGAKWFRVGVEVRIVYTDNSSVWYAAWHNATATPSSFNGRIVRKLAVPQGKTVRTIDSAKIQIWDITADSITVKNPKLELGTIATDWTPAPEDTPSDAVTTAMLDEYKSAQATKDTANAQKITTLQTQVNGQTASIQQHATSIDGLKAQYTVKIDTGGRVSGFGLASGGGVSDFAVNADKFYIAPPTGRGKGITPFVVQTTTQTINGVRVPAGTYINDAFIRHGSIGIAHIDKASIKSLSALSADIGTLTTKDARGSFTYTGSKIELRDPQGRLLMEMGLL
ncbi:phage tail protein [Moraxella sp. ZJ142]|uniref:TipJ family phage tail tip protein n=1 Tax=Moraxella marmotae TaxID=3344520 RepID=UPI0035D43125